MNVASWLPVGMGQVAGPPVHTNGTPLTPSVMPFQLEIVNSMANECVKESSEGDCIKEEGSAV